MRRRVIAIILIMTHITVYLPAQDFNIGVRQGLGRLEVYLDRAQRERSAMSWEQIAVMGMEAALLEWESANIYIRERDYEQWQEQREEAQWIFGLAKEAAYIGWAGQRLYMEAARAEGSALTAELRQAASEWIYTREDGTGSRVIDMSESGNARAAWELVSGGIIDRYLTEWEQKNKAAFMELRERFSGSELEAWQTEEILLEVSATQREAILKEYARIAGAEGNDLLRLMLYDSQSLKKQAAAESAAAIARRLTEEARASTDQELGRLFRELEEAIDGVESEGIRITSEEWVASFRSALEAGLTKWDEAEHAFLVSRAEWERNAEITYWEGQEVWMQAYRQLEEAREMWERELQEKLNFGRLEWSQRQKDLYVEIETALEDFIAVLEERKDNRRKLLNAQVMIYDSSRELLELAAQGLEIWYEQWGSGYRRIETRYVELYGQNPYDDYEIGYILGLLNNVNIGALTSGGEAEYEKQRKQIELWRQLYLEVIRKLHIDENKKLEEMQRGYERDIEKSEKIKDEYEKEIDKLLAKIAEKEKIGNNEEDIKNAENIIKTLREDKEKTEEEIIQLENHIEKLRKDLALLKPVLALTANSEASEIRTALQGAHSLIRFSQIGMFNEQLWQASYQLINGESGWLALAHRYRREADNAVRNVYEISGIDINQLTINGYTDELSAEILKAEAVMKYWESELQIARAVEEYARRFDSSVESAQETSDLLKQARVEYDEALLKYQSALDTLYAKGDDIAAANEEFRKREESLRLLNEKVQEARNKYAVIMAMILGVSTEYINEAIAKTALELEKNETERAKKYDNYLKAVQSFDAAQRLSALSRETENIKAGIENQQSIAALERKIEEVKGVTEAEDILSQYKAMLGDDFHNEQELLTRLGEAYTGATGAEKGYLGEAIKGVWASVLMTYGERLLATRRALEYLYGRGTLAEAVNEEKYRESELRAWLNGQLAGIEFELRYAEATDAMKLGQQQAMIEKLLEAENILTAVKDTDVRWREDFTKILWFDTYLGLAGQGIAWETYRLKQVEYGLEAALADEQTRNTYSDYVISEINASDAQARMAVEALIPGRENLTAMSIGQLYGLIEELTRAGSGLGLAGQTALGEYIQGLLEYAAVRDVRDNVSIKSLGDVRAAFTAANARFEETLKWLDAVVVSEPEVYFTQVLGSREFASLSGTERELMLSYGAALLLQKLNWQDVALDFTTFMIHMHGRSVQAWASSYLKLNEDIQKAMYDQMRVIARFDGYTNAYDLYVHYLAEAGEEAGILIHLYEDYYRKYLDLLALAEEGSLEEKETQELAALEELFAGENASLFEKIHADENIRNMRWYEYYLAGEGFLYVYLLLGDNISGIELSKALEYLNDEHAEFISSYHKVRNLADRYNPYLDGDAAAWVRTLNLNADESERLLDLLLYGYLSTGIGYMRDWELASWHGNGSALRVLLMHGMNDAVNLLYEILTGLQREMFLLQYEIQYVQYAEQERTSGGEWIAKYQTFLAGFTGEQRNNLDKDQEEALEKLSGDASSRMLGRYEERLEQLAELFKNTNGGIINGDIEGKPPESLQSQMVQLRSLMRNASNEYYNAAGLTRMYISQIDRQLDQYNVSKTENAHLQAEQTRLFNELIGAEAAYKNYHDNEYSQAVLDIQTSYVLYNEAVAALNTAHEQLNEARLEVRKRQEIYDFAQSIYLRDFGGATAQGYETPKEKLGRVEYAYERARISFEVLESIKGGSPFEDVRYKAAHEEYVESTKKYYLGLVIEFEAEKSLAKQKEILAQAERAEMNALQMLVIRKDKYEVPEHIPNLNSGWIASYTGITESNIEDYFTKSTGEREGSMVTQAEADTITWLLQLKEKLEVNSEYFNDLMLAAMYANYLCNESEEKKKNWYGEGLDPSNAKDYQLDTITDLEANSETGNSYAERYRKARMKVLEDAYKRVMEGGGAYDLARYLLFRDTTLVISGTQYEKDVLTAMSLDEVIEWTEDRRNYYSNRERVMWNRSVVAFVFGDLFNGGILAAISADSLRQKNNYEEVRKKLVNLRDGAIRGKQSTDEKLNRLLKDYLEKIEKTKTAKENLNLMMYGTKEEPAADTDGVRRTLNYDEFISGLEALFSGNDILADALSLYSESVFNNSAAKHHGSVTDAMKDLLNDHLKKEQEQAQKTLNESKAALMNAQTKKQTDYWTLAAAGQKMNESDRQELKRLSVIASDPTLSVSERNRAANQYDELYAKIFSAENIEQELREAALKAWGVGTWNSHTHDASLISYFAGLYDNNHVQWNQSKEPYTAWGQFNTMALINEALERQSEIELYVERTRLDLISEDFIRQRDFWEAQMAQLAAVSESEWERARGRLNTDYNTWQRSFAEEYEAKTTAWEVNYLQFVLDKQEWVETQYVYATNAAATGMLMQAETDTGDVIARALEGTIIERMSRDSLDVSSYVDTLLEGTALSRIMAGADSLSGRARFGAQAAQRGNARETVIESLHAAQKTQRLINEQIHAAAAQIAAYNAEKMLKEAIAAYMERIDSENKEMRNWQERFVRGAGYNIESGVISRREVVDSTIRGPITETQYVHSYVNFVTAPPRISVDININALVALDPNTIMDILGQRYRDLETWGEKIFGKVENGEIVQRMQQPTETLTEALDNARTSGKTKDEISALENELRRISQKERDGELGEHIGYNPVFRTGDDFKIKDGREANIEHHGKGEMGKILLDFQWNNITSTHGWMEAAKPTWDQKWWGNNEGLDPPTIRGMITMVGQIAGTIVSTAWPGWGTLISFGINLTNDALFATLDTVYTNTNNEKIWADFGKKTVVNAVSSAMSFGAGAASKAVTSALGTTTNVALHAAAQGALSASVSYASSVTMAYIDAFDFETGKMDWKAANSSWTSTSTFANALGSGISAGIGNFLKNPGVLTYEQQKYWGGAISLGTSMSGKIAEYSVYTAHHLANGNGWNSFNKAFDDMGGLTFNIANLGAMFDFAMSMYARTNETGQLANSSEKINRIGTIRNLLSGIGVFEVNIGSGGISSRFGTGGIDLGGALYDLGKRGLDYSQMMRIEDQKTRETALTLYGWGDWTGENTSMRITSGIDDLIFDKDFNGYGLTVNNGKGRTITIQDSGDVNLNAVFLQHEAYRDGVVTIGNNLETRMAALAHTEMAMRMIDGGQTIEFNRDLFGDMLYYKAALAANDMSIFFDYVDENYDSSADYWKLMKDGRLLYDGETHLYDEDGRLLKESKFITLSDSLAQWMGITKEKAIEIMKDKDKYGMVHEGGITWSKPSNADYGATALLEYQFEYEMIREFRKYTDQMGTKYNNSMVEALDAMLRDNIEYIISNGNNDKTSGILRFYGNEYNYAQYYDTINSNNKEITEKSNGNIFSIKDLRNNEILLYMVDTSNSVINGLLKQDNEAFSSISGIKDGGCNFLATLAYAQLVTGRNLSTNQILSIWKEAETKKMLDSNGYVRGQNYIADLALQKLGRTDIGLSFDGTMPRGSTLIGYRITVPFSDTGHHMVGDIYEHVVWNPDKTTGKTSGLRSVYVYPKR